MQLVGAIHVLSSKAPLTPVYPTVMDRIVNTMFSLDSDQEFQVDQINEEEI